MLEDHILVLLDQLELAFAQVLKLFLEGRHCDRQLFFFECLLQKLLSVII